MKKFHISILALLIALSGFGCSKKPESTGTDTMQSNPQKAIGQINFTNPTTKIMPPVAAPNPITITSMGNNRAIVSAYFAGTASQSVSLGAVGSMVSSTLNQWTSVIIPGNTSTPFSITARVNNKPYLNFTTSPGQPGVNNGFGLNVTMWSDTSKDTVIVVVQDSAVTAP